MKTSSKTFIILLEVKKKYINNLWGKSLKGQNALKVKVRNSGVFMYLDSKSIVSVYFIKQKETFVLRPLSYTIDLEFENKQQRNLMGEIAGILKTFKGGTLKFNLNAADFFELPAKMLDGDLDFFISYVNEDDLSLIYDKLKVSIASIRFEGSDESLHYFMEFELLDTIYRKVEGDPDFVPLFSTSATYFIATSATSDAMRIKVKNTASTVELPFITHLSYLNKNEIDIKRFESLNMFDFNTRGVSCGVLEIGTIIYPQANLHGELPVETSSSNVISTLMHIFEGSSSQIMGNKFYTLSIEHEMVNTLNILELDFILLDIKAEYKNNATHLLLTFVENRFQELQIPSMLGDIKQQIMAKSPFTPLSLACSELTKVEQKTLRQILSTK